jgi:hypothetical protein
LEIGPCDGFLQSTPLPDWTSLAAPRILKEEAVWQRKFMAIIRPLYSKEEFARRGDGIYEREIRLRMEAAQEGHFAAIDLETEAFEVDADELAASDRLAARIPNAQIWLRRVGSRYARRFGPRSRSV